MKVSFLCNLSYVEEITIVYDECKAHIISRFKILTYNNISGTFFCRNDALKEENMKKFIEFLDLFFGKKNRSTVLLITIAVVFIVILFYPKLITIIVGNILGSILEGIWGALEPNMWWLIIVVLVFLIYFSYRFFAEKKSLGKVDSKLIRVLDKVEKEIVLHNKVEKHRQVKKKRKKK
jgi:hypothetical protein